VAGANVGTPRLSAAGCISFRLLDVVASLARISRY